MVSKAADKSSKTSTTVFLPSAAVMMSFFTQINAVSGLQQHLYADWNGLLRILMDRQLFRRIATAFSMIFVKKDKFDTGLQFFSALQSKACFLIKSFTWASFKDVRKMQVESEGFTMFVTGVISTSCQSVSSHVGSGSS